MWKKNPVIVVVGIICFMIAGLLDLKNRGLFFRLLPSFVQDYLVGRGISKGSD
ncbi:hypothetical protein [Virgibacillus oceani]|uniref:Uncharacterized protein n=1 Tax=Virgibacillus oceani TaxID=1479511 RepID=A0A917M3J0_9BACI|nr:hypothetical protein [Virgibacillus oceani]GGG76933.1 hypothetical protein GCM10011398_22470 [Virgibacillus oceani]